MTTELKKFTEAYATMTIASYQPLILKWISGWSIYVAADAMAWRAQKAKYLKPGQAFATAQLLNIGKIRPTLPRELSNIIQTQPPPTPRPIDASGHDLTQKDVRSVKLDGYPNAVAVGDKIYPNGILDVQATIESLEQPAGIFTRAFRSVFSGSSSSQPKIQGNPYIGTRTLPSYVSGRLGLVDPDFDFAKSRKAIFTKMIEAVNVHLNDPSKLLAGQLRAAMQDVGGLSIFEFWPRAKIEEALSPIGIAHYYRQLYFNAMEGFGPIEQAFTVAPLETLEVVYELTRRQIHEEIVEVGTETVSETATETKNLDEVSDKVSSMIQRDISAGMSTNASGSIGVWQFGASASANMATSSQRSREDSSRRLKEVTKRASERITKSYSLKIRDLEDVTTVNLTRRVIKNDLDHPVSYGLRRVLRRVRVKVQDLGPLLVWQLYVRNPGAGLAKSRFVHFREAEPISTPEIPPGLPPRPKGDTDTGSTSSDLAWDNTRDTYYVTVVINAGGDRRVTAVSIDSIQDLEGGGKDDPAPSPRNDVQWGPGWDANTNTFTKHVAIMPGDSLSVQISYTYSWEPSQHVLDEWEAERQRLVNELTQAALNEQFEREKELITERSKIRPRPANDLRREERYEVLNRLISHLFARGDDPSDPTPLEIEYFHRYFNIDAMFIYTHPSWWKPRYAPVATGLSRPAYEITSESEPAPMGSSLGWLIQLDGDTRRNEFINSPWLRICMPIRPNREREAVEWLAKHVEGEFGYDPNSGALKGLLADIEAYRADEQSLGLDGPNYVQVDSTVGAPEGPARPENVYPVIDEFEVTVPTDGFVFDELVISGS